MEQSALRDARLRMNAPRDADQGVLQTRGGDVVGAMRNADGTDATA